MKSLPLLFVPYLVLSSLLFLNNQDPALVKELKNQEGATGEVLQNEDFQFLHEVIAPNVSHDYGEDVTFEITEVHYLSDDKKSLAINYVTSSGDSSNVFMMRTVDNSKDRSQRATVFSCFNEEKNTKFEFKETTEGISYRCDGRIYKMSYSEEKEK